MSTSLSVEEIDALERLLKEWEVPRADCTPMERVGFFRLKKKGRVELRSSVYFMPSNLTWEGFDDWFMWFEVSLGIRES
tara:strand:+ start:8142 stop:8378 length:237 start_codon:yes stop_codon:yes gene_type:complete